jgi:putative MATE family efflux protein
LKDLTEGPITGHLLQMAAFMAIGMIGQTLYYLVDLYFVSGLGSDAVAGVGTAGNIAFLVLAATQILAVGTVTLISHAVGRKDQPGANLVFNQSLVLSAACAAAVLILGYTLTVPYLRSVAADQGTIDAGAGYLYWFLPGLALQFAMVSMSSALRGTGIVKPTMTLQVLTVVLNVILAPILIAGWGTGYPLGVVGAGLASTISIAIGVLLLVWYFVRLEKYVGFHSSMWRPRLDSWKRLLNIGLPAGGEFALIFVFAGIIYWCIRGFGAEAQAAFGIGGRIMQSIFLPAMAIAFAVAPVAGQNFGARRGDRVRETFVTAALIETVVMAAMTLLCAWAPHVLVEPFTNDPQVLAMGSEYLQIVAWNFVAAGLIFCCSGMFQAMGNTWPSLLSSATRLVIFAVPAIWMSRQPGFQLKHLWYLSVATYTVQAVFSYLLVRRELRRKLVFAPA